MTTEKLAKLFHGIGINAVGRDVGGTESLSETVALLFRARGDDNFGKHVGVLGTLRRHHRSDATGADNHYFSHQYIFKN